MIFYYPNLETEIFCMLISERKVAVTHKGKSIERCIVRASLMIYSHFLSLLTVFRFQKLFSAVLTDSHSLIVRFFLTEIFD